MDILKLKGIANQQFFKHGISHWSFILTDTGRRLGVCKERLSRIEISEHYAKNSPDANVIDTLMHEIAHALVGCANGHNDVWKRKAFELGATPRACDTATDTVMKPSDWKAVCPCGTVFYRYRQPKKMTGRCAKCNGRFTFEFVGNPALKPIIKEVKCWHSQCPGCKNVHKKFRRPKYLVGYRCAVCVGRCVLPAWKFGVCNT